MDKSYVVHRKYFICQLASFLPGPFRVTAGNTAVTLLAVSLNWNPQRVEISILRLMFGFY
jgi:hypothetical protein